MCAALVGYPDSLLVSLVLRQVVGDLEPWGLVADKYVRGWADLRRIDERTESHVDVSAITDDGIQQQAADLAVNVMVRSCIAINQNLRLAFGEAELGALDTSKGFEG